MSRVKEVLDWVFRDLAKRKMWTESKLDYRYGDGMHLYLALNVGISESKHRRGLGVEHMLLVGSFLASCVEWLKCDSCHCPLP